MIDRGFRSGCVARVVAETMVVNTGSRRVMEKAGMTLVRTFHANFPIHITGGEKGDVEYAITQAGWELARRLDACQPEGKTDLPLT